jgi:hypothetical protein
MASHCDWCGGATENGTAISISHRDRPGIEYNTNSDITSSSICYECTERLTEKMAQLRRTLGLNPHDSQEELARQMIMMTDLTNSEPPDRVWEDTFQKFARERGEMPVRER